MMQLQASAHRSREAAESGMALTCHTVAAVGFSITCSLSEVELAVGCSPHDGRPVLDRVACSGDCTHLRAPGGSTAQTEHGQAGQGRPALWPSG